MVIRNLLQEAAIAELLIKEIKHSLDNKIYSKKNEIKVGVSTEKPELFESLKLIVKKVEI